MCLRYEMEENEFLHEAEMLNLLRRENILAFYGVVIGSSYSSSLALVSKLFVIITSLSFHMMLFFFLVLKTYSLGWTFSVVGCGCGQSCGCG